MLGKGRIRAALLLLALAVWGGVPPVSADAADDGVRRPLLQPGRKTLWQRVISHPGAAPSATPGGQAAADLRSFTPLYVYDRRQVGGEEWLEVSPSSSGTARGGWLRASQCSPWDKALTLMFADRMGRDPVLFFRRHDDLDALVRSENMRADFDRTHRRAREANGPLLAVEPTDSAIPRKRFYLMPIFDYSDEYEQHGLRLLNVGVVDPGQAPGASRKPAAPAPSAAPRRFTAGVAFIVDTTISMGPYIEQTKSFIRESYDMLSRSPIADDVSFAVVAYRNSLRHDSRLEYVSTVVSPFAPVSGRRMAEMRIERMDEARVSTHAFNEDAFAGIKTAIDELDWSGHAIKIAILVTDAGAIRNDDPLSGTHLNEREMADLLMQKGIRLVVIHLHTPQGRKHNLNGAVEQYKRLTTVRDARFKSLYLPLPAQDSRKASGRFAGLARSMVDVLENLVAKAASGGAVPAPAAAAAPPSSAPEDDAARMAESLGYAAYLEFVGERRRTAAPGVMNAWVADKDLASLVQGRPADALTAAVLLNKRQLDALDRQLGMLIEAADSSRTTSGELFQYLSSLAAQTMRDPERMQDNPGANLLEAGLVPEFLAGLPYRSQVLGLTSAQWASMGGKEQDELVLGLKSKRRLYREYHNDTDNWESFGSPDPGDALYRVPLTSLP